MPKSAPLSEKRLAANRANARKSTGPRTPEGKAASSRNAVKHGFCASSFFVVRLEELGELDKLKADAVSCYAPVNAQELFAVERIALAQLQIFRAARLEAGLFTNAFNEAFDPYDAHPVQPMAHDLVDGIEVTREQNRGYALAEGFRKLVKESNIWSLHLRYQAQAERMYRRAIEEFNRLRALRECTGSHSGCRCELCGYALPNEPNIGIEPEQTEELVSPPEPASKPELAPQHAPRAPFQPPFPLPPPLPGSPRLLHHPSPPENARQHSSSPLIFS